MGTSDVHTTVGCAVVRAVVGEDHVLRCGWAAVVAGGHQLALPSALHLYGTTVALQQLLTCRLEVTETSSAGLDVACGTETMATTVDNCVIQQLHTRDGIVWHTSCDSHVTHVM